MNKAEFINSLSDKTGLNKADAQRAADAVLEIIEETLGKGDVVSFTGFGVFSVKNTSERQGRNPSTGQAITIPASKKPFFTPGKRLKESVA